MFKPQTQNKDVNPIVALMIAIGLAILFVGISLKPEQIAKAKLIFENANNLCLLIGLGTLYWIFEVASWAHKHLELRKPGQGLEVLKNRNEKKVSVSFNLLHLTLFISFAILLASSLSLLLASEAKFLSSSWYVSFALLLPFSSAVTDILGSLLRKLFAVKLEKSLTALPSFPSVNAEHGIRITIGSADEEIQAPKWISFDETDLLKSCIITGGVGFGKTQLIFRMLDQLFQAYKTDTKKISFLILDPKGDIVSTACEMALKHDRSNDLVLIGSAHQTTWNPLKQKDALKEGRFRDIAERFKAAMINYQGGGSSDPFWIEAGANLIAWMIWLSLIAMDEVSFTTLYKLLLVTASTPQDSEDPLDRILSQAEKKVGSLAEEDRKEQEINFETCKLYIKSDFRRIPDKTRMNIVANLSSFLQVFLSAEAQRIFSPSKDTASFQDMSEIIDQGKILILDMTQNDQAGLCRAVGTLLKLSYQNAIMIRLAKGGKPTRLACLVLDEYQNFATSSHGETQFGDDRFFDQCRAAKGFGIVATQSYATLKSVFKSESASHELLGQISNKITFATDEPSTCAYFKRLAGKKWIARHSESISETSSNAKKLFLKNDLETERSSVGISFSTSDMEVDVIKDDEIAKLPPFKALAALKLKDGPQTGFLYTRPLFDPMPHLPFKDMAQRIAILLVCFFASNLKGELVPNICDAIQTPYFPACLSPSVGSCMCRRGPLTYPCAQVSYWIPKTFVEVSPRIGESYFNLLPPVKMQTSTAYKVWSVVLGKLGAGGLSLINSGPVDDNGTSFFHVHTAPVFLSHEIMKGLPCGNPSSSVPCLTAMSEHHPVQWSCGYFDFKQPQLLGNQLCGSAVGGAQSVLQSSRRFLEGPIGQLLESLSGTSLDVPSAGAGCSNPLVATLGSFNVSTELPCLGSLGSIFPRYGSVNGPTNISGAFMAAYKFRSLAAEHFKTVPNGISERWQLLKPNASSCGFPGENMLFWETTGMLTPRDRFLFLVWERKSCCVEHVRAGFGTLLLKGAKAACHALRSRYQ